MKVIETGHIYQPVNRQEDGECKGQTLRFIKAFSQGRSPAWPDRHQRGQRAHASTLLACAQRDRSYNGLAGLVIDGARRASFRQGITRRLGTNGTLMAS
jgi:hypothetical protein